MYKNILVSVDLNDPTSWQKALPTAVELCQSYSADLHVLAVMPDVGMSMVGYFLPGDYNDKVIAEARKKLHELIDAEVPDDLETQAMVEQGTIYHEIIEAANKVGADLIVMASHRPGLSDYLLGPNAARVVRHYRGSVLVVRN